MMLSSKKKLFQKIFLTLILFCLHSKSATDDYQAAMALFQGGKAEEGKILIASLYKKNPSDPLVKLQYAFCAPCSTALKLYQELCSAPTVGDSIKVEASCRLGDFFFASKEYGKAVELYRQASSKGKDPFYKHKWALASMLCGDFEAAKSLWYTLTLEYGDLISEKANYYLGLLHLKQGRYQEAYDCFLKSGKTDPKNSWTIAALACKYECAFRLGKTDKIKTYKEQLSMFKNTLLESKLLFPLENAENKVVSESVPVPVTASENSTVTQEFTLQVGAFGSADNADNLRKTLNRTFRNVTVIPVTVDEQVFYRVRVGKFLSRNDAEIFGKDTLSKAGYNFKVVQK